MCPESHDYAKLVSPKACQHIFGTNLLCHATSDFSQYLITGSMPELVIDTLKAVQI